MIFILRLINWFCSHQFSPFLPWLKCVLIWFSVVNSSSRQKKFKNQIWKRKTTRVFIFTRKQARRRRRRNSTRTLLLPRIATCRRKRSLFCGEEFWWKWSGKISFLPHTEKESRWCFIVIRGEVLPEEEKEERRINTGRVWREARTRRLNRRLLLLLLLLLVKMVLRKRRRKRQ